VEQAIAFEIEEALPLPLEDLVLAHEQTAVGPDHTDVLAVIAPRATVAEHLAAMQRLGLDPRHVEVEGLVLANLSNALHLGSAPHLLLDVGHRKTTLCLLVDGRPELLRTIPIAGQHFTSALARELGLDDDAAERHKHEQGLFEQFSTKPASAAVERLLDRLMRELRRSIQSVRSDDRDPRTATSIVLCGGGAAAPGLAGYLAEQSGLPCQALALPPDAEGLAELREDTAVYAHAAALALRAAGRQQRATRVDLRQDEFRYVADLSGLRAQLRLTLGLFGLVLALWIASLGTQLWSARRYEAALGTELGRVYEATLPGETAPAEPTNALEAKLRETRELANHLGVVGGGISVLEVLRHISEHIPADLDISLSDLRLERHTVRARGYTRDFNSVDRMRAELEKVDAFEEVVLSDVVNEPRRGGKSFALTIQFAGSSE
jgi:cell division ATPase FtsA